MNPHFGPPARVAGATLLALASLLTTFDVCAKQWYVQSGGAQVAFSPQFLTIQAGDTVTFLNLGGYHNVVADDGSFRCAHGCDGDGQGGSGNASDSLWFATVSFPNAGTVGYFCEPHGSPGGGMYGTIEVVAPAPPAPVVPAPSGNAGIDALLALVVTAVGLLRLRSIARGRTLDRAARRQR
jgi:plastocyanin